MARITVTVSDARHRALKEAAAHTGKTIGQLIEDALDAYGLKTREEAAAYVARARERAGLDEAEALELAVDETARARGRKE